MKDAIIAILVGVMVLMSLQLINRANTIRDQDALIEKKREYAELQDAYIAQLEERLASDKDRLGMKIYINGMRYVPAEDK